MQNLHYLYIRSMLSICCVIFAYMPVAELHVFTFIKFDVQIRAVFADPVAILCYPNVTWIFS